MSVFFLLIDRFVTVFWVLVFQENLLENNLIPYVLET